MSVEEKFGHFFKAESRRSGEKFLAKSKVTLSSGSETTIQVYVKTSPVTTVLLTSAGITSESFTVKCSCPAGKKRQFCKHVWAALLVAEKEKPDFLSLKRDIEISNEKSAEAVRPVRVDLDRRRDFEKAAKERAAKYRKEEYQKNKERVKHWKQSKSAVRVNEFSPEIEAALRYFAKNGFPMPNGPDAQAVALAKRKLSRVFHPDSGGSDAEITELNHFCDLALQFKKR